MSFNSEYQELRKKRKKQEENQQKVVSGNPLNTTKQTKRVSGNPLNDIAPVREQSTIAQIIAPTIAPRRQTTTKTQTQKPMSFDEKLTQKYSTMSLADIEKEYARVEAEEKAFKDANGGKAINYLSKIGSYLAEGKSGQSMSASRDKSQANIDKLDDLTREKEIISIYRKKKATEEYLGGLSKEQLQLLDDVAEADEIADAEPLYNMAQSFMGGSSGTLYLQTTPERERGKASREKLYGQLKEKQPDKSDEELNKLIDNMVELRRSQVNAEEQAKRDAEAKEKAKESAVSSFILSRGANLVGGATGLAELYMQRDNEYGLDTNAFGFAPTNASNTIDEQIMVDHDWKIDVGGNEVDGFDFFYKFGTGVVDNVGRLVASGGNTTMAGAMMFAQGTTQTIIDSKEKGYSDAKALTKGLLNGTFEALTEKFSLDLILKGGGSGLKQIAKSFVAEGSEEVTSNWLNRIADTISEGKHSDLSKLYEQYINEGYTESQALTEVVMSVIGEDFESFLISGLAGGTLGGGVAIANSVAQKQANKLTDTEQSVVDKVVESRIAEKEADGKKLTNREKNKIYDDVIRDLDKGYISTDTIEEVLGGETYKSYKDTVDKEDALYDRFEKLGEKVNPTLKDQHEYSELAKLVEEHKNKSQRTQLKTQLSDEVFNIAKNSRLVESYNERARAYEGFKADTSKFKDAKNQDAVKQTLGNAEKSGMNNTNKMRDLVESHARFSGDTGLVFHYKSGEEIKNNFIERQTAKIKELESIENRTPEQNEYIEKLKDKLEKVKSGKIKVNGEFVDGGVVINLDSPTAFQFTTGHEVTHKLEKANSYENLVKTLKRFAGEDFDRRVAEQMAIYEGVSGYDLENLRKDVEREVVADLVGEYLFTDSKFINNLSTENPNLFKRIYDEIKYLCKIATAGSKEARELEKVKRAFEKAYKESANTKVDTKADAKYSLSAEQQEYFKDSKVRDEKGNLKVMYHGTSKGGHTVFDTFGESKFGLFGAGTYFTDNKDIANTYTEKGRGDSPQVYEAYLNITNPIDMDAEADINAWQKAFADADYSNCVTNEDCFKAMKEVFVDEQYPQWEAKDTAMDVLQSMGYDGITHIGGGRVNADGTRHQVYIAFEPEQIKNIDNIAPTKDADIRYSLSSMANTFFEDPNMSANDFMKVDYKQTQGYKDYVEQCVNNYRQTRVDFDETVAKKEVEDQIDGIVRVAIASKNAGYDIADDSQKRNLRDSKKRLLFSSLEPNSEYTTSHDISTLCDKRRNFAEIYDAIVKREEALGVPQGKRFFDNVDNYFYIHKVLADKGLTQPCRQCYVESMRKNLTPMATAFLELVNETNPNNKSNKQLYQQSGKNKGNLKSNNAKLRERVLEILAEYDMSVDNPSMETLTTEDGLAQLRLQAPLVYEAFNSFYGQSKPKMPKSATPFRFGELTALLTDENGKIKQSLVDNIKSTGGFRLQSYSDFQIENFVDTLQVLFEAGTLGLNAHAYTKVPAFLDATEGTNLKRNISIFMYKDGDEWKLDKNDSFPYDLEEIYDIVKNDKSGNTSIIAVSQNADMSAWIMANDNVGYFIPFHKSGLKMGTVRDTDIKTEDGRTIKGYSGTIDHTKQQTEVWAKTTADHKANTKVKKAINIYSFWDFDNKSNLSKNDLIKKNVKEYINQCEMAGYLPKFRDYVMNNDKLLNNVLNYSKKLGFAPQDATIDDISFEYKGYRIPYGYYKCLGDFGMFTPDGKASPHDTVSLANYDFDKAEAFFNDAQTLRRNEILQQFANGEERRKYRDSDLTAGELEDIVKQKRNEVADSIVAPTSYSLLDADNLPKLKGSHLTYGEDIKLRTTEDIAPVVESTPVETAEQVAPVEDTIPDEFAPISEAEANAIREEGFTALDDMDAPIETSTEPYYIADTTRLDDKTLKNISAILKDALTLNKAETKAIQDIVQNYSTSETQNTTDLFNEIKDRFGEKAWTERNEAIAEVKQTLRAYKLFVSPTIKGDIADYSDFMRRNFGKIRFSKEGMPVDTAYMELTATYPEFFPPDVTNATDQLLKMSEVANMDINEYLTEMLDDETIQEATDIIADIVNTYKENAIRQGVETDRQAYFNQLNRYEELLAKENKGKYESIKPRPEKQPKMVRADKVKDNAEQQTAKIIHNEPQAEMKKSNIWSKFVSNFVDKGAPVETLALKKHNRELDGKYHAIKRAEGMAQTFIAKGTDGVKSLKDLLEEVKNDGLVEAFDEYLYHKHNVDRMTLEDRYEDVQNKAVFGDSVTAEVSQEIVNQYELAIPKLKEYAQDIYNIHKHLRKMLVSDGDIISQETADLWEEMYPHYVPIHRKGDLSLSINVPLDTGKTGVNAPIKRATGGNQDFYSVFETTAERILQTYKAVAKNRFGVELKNTLGTTIENAETSLDEVVENIDTQDSLLQEGKNGRNPTFTVFENGEKVTFEISEEMYDALKPTNKVLATSIKPLKFLNDVRRGLLTEYNPTFILTNPIKDLQDVLMNSQHPAQTYKNVPKAIMELKNKNGRWYNEYMENGGEQNTYFDKETNAFKEEKKGFAKLIGIPLDKISDANNFIERIPRLAEYIASRELGRSIDVSMLDSARVTTNFSAGGDVTKFANRNGFTFLNASVQGAMQQVRNVREAKYNGLKGWVQLATKVAVAGLPAMLLNGLLWDDDEEYEELSDYVKENYYIVGKFNDGQFVRIPKGRAVAVIQNAFEQIGNALTGDDEVDLKRFTELVISNLAPNNPLDNNIIAPIKQAIENKTWYGEDLVPSRLQDLPTNEQYDESTDAISKWLGENFDPLKLGAYKINYLLDQYSGGLGDMVLPMLTPEAESGNNSLGGNLLAPIKDKFTTDSVMNNQAVSDFYETSDELTTNAKSSKATDEDILKYKYFSSVQAELGELYAQKREIQNSDLADDVKYRRVRDIQEKINTIAENTLNTYGTVNIDRNYANVGGKHYRLNDENEWTKINDKQLEKQREVTSGLNITPAEYWNNKAEYDYAYESPEKYAVAKAVGGYSAYKTYSSEMYDIKADKDQYGKSISGSRKAKVLDYINNLDIDYYEKLILFKSEYNADDTYNYEIIEYLDSRDDISWEEEMAILKELGFNVRDDGYIWWD